jgi:hypothetical protein
VSLSDIDAEDLDSFLEEVDMDAETRDKVKQEKKRLEDEVKRQKQLEAGLFILIIFYVIYRKTCSRRG